MKKKFQIGYESTGSVQMTFLRLLHEEIRQNFTYTCINSVAWFNARLGNYDSAIKFIDESETEFTVDSVNKIAVIHDGCKVSL